MQTPLAFAVVAAIVASSAAASPHGHEELWKLIGGARFSDNVLEDARLDAPELILKYGYPLEIHNVETEDGYILQIHRIPHGRDANNDPRRDRPAVLLQHGLFCSSADWINMGPGSALGYLLAEEGYDVWLGNARGNYYSRKHRRYDPDGWLTKSNFWSFSWEEIGYYDLPAMIDYALKVTGKSKLHYVGHSQGTTAFFVMASMRPEYNEKIISMHALAPVAYIGNVQSPLLAWLASHATTIDTVASIIGVNEFLPNSNLMTWLGTNFCMDEVATQILCTNILFIAGGKNEEQLNATTIPIILGHTPAGAASKQLIHYAQGISSGEFRRYDLGRINNLLKYGRTTPPDFPLEKITSPVFLHYADADYLAEPNDVDKLFRRVTGAVGKFRIQDTKFSHIDFMWAINAKEYVWDRAITLMKQMDFYNSDDNIP